LVDDGPLQIDVRYTKEDLEDDLAHRRRRVIDAAFKKTLAG